MLEFSIGTMFESSTESVLHFDIFTTGIIDNYRIFRVYSKKGIFFPRFRQKKWPFLCVHEKTNFWNTQEGFS